MKLLAIIILCILFLTTITLAAPEDAPLTPQLTSANEQDSITQPLLPKMTAEEVRLLIKDRKYVTEQGIYGETEEEQEIYLKQSKISAAMQVFLVSKGMSLDETKTFELMELINVLETSVPKTIELENKINKKSKFARFLTGGNAKAAKEFRIEYQKRKEPIETWRQVIAEEEDMEIKSLLLEQFENIDVEQERQEQLAQKELTSKGIIGWIWK